MNIKRVLAKIRKNDEKYHMIADGDRIGIGLSGGKDSAVLLYAMYLYRYLAKQALNKEFDIVGIHIDLGFGESSFTEQRSFFEKYHIELYAEKSRIKDILDLHQKNERISCSLCSTLKKGAVVAAAKKLNCNKVAFAHHADDAIETLFLNMIYGGRIATFDPKMLLERSGITFIRPLITVFESELAKTARELAIPIIKSNCPNDGNSQRQAVKELLHSIYHQYPGAKENFLSALEKSDKVHLFDDLNL